jgi:hypothetical protein
MRTVTIAAFLPLLATAFVMQPLPSTRGTESALFYSDKVVPSFIASPVLQQVYPKMLEYKQKYGHPNIPLGSSEGRQCYTLRRLQIQQKLSDEEVSLLKNLGFRFDSLEDVYYEFDFDDMFDRLLAYEAENHNTYQIPKKYPNDPELGAWVTGLRRLGNDVVKDEHAQRLNEVSFTWVSTRKCGSKFMKQYRELVERVGEHGREDLVGDEPIQKWIAAQRLVRKRGELSDTRFHYMQELLGEDWMEQAKK